MKRRGILSCAVLATVLFTACEKELFDQEKYRETVKSSFPITDIDPNHNWATIGRAQVELGVNTGTGKHYDVRIYDENPIGSKGDITLLGQGSVDDGGWLSTEIDYPLAQQYVFVALLDPTRFMTVYPVAIKDGRIAETIGTRQTAQSRLLAARRQKSHDVTFADAPAASLFATAIPGDAKDEDLYHNTKSGNFFVKTGDTQVNVWEGRANIYFGPGTYNITSLGLNNNTNFYLLSGANVTMPGAIKYGNVNFYIAEGAQLKTNINANVHYYNKGTLACESVNLYSVAPNPYWNDPSCSDGIVYNEGTFSVDGTLQIDDRCQIVNTGTITAGKLTVDEDAQFLNKGLLTISGHLGVENDESLFINEGTCSAASVGVAGSADFYNDGTTDISGETTVSSNQATWHNDGTYTTGKFTYTAGSTDVINNCRMIVKDRFYIGLGDTDRNSFQMNGGASVVTKDFEFAGPGFIMMGAGSLFQVTNTAYMAITKDTYGIYGPTTGKYAVFQAKSIVRRSDVSVRQGFVANYFNRLFVATDSHFNFGYSDKSDAQLAAGEVGSQPYYRLDTKSGALMTTYSGADVNIEAGTCSPGYGGKPEPKEPECTTFSLRYCFEDNFPDVGDYDFNDAVITVTPTIKGKNVRLKVTLDAVGATKQLAAAIRVVGLKNSNVKSCTRTGNMDADYPTTSRTIIDGAGANGLVDDNAKNNTTDVVISLFNNAHWSIGHTIASIGSVENWFYNTVEPSSTHQFKKNGIAPAEVTFDFELDSEEAAQHFSEKDLDVFILEPYNAAYWEVHTVPFKTDEVMKAHATGFKKKYYNDNFPWAICVPGSFRYPFEWVNIGSDRNGEIVGAYKEPQHSFAEWASDQDTATDWYKYPSEDLIYIP